MRGNHSKPRVGIFGLTGCAGDQLQILNCEDHLLELARDLDIVDWVMVRTENDHGSALDLGFVEGVVATERDLECLREVRERSQTLVAIGTCAVWGGLPAMQNSLPREVIEEKAGITFGRAAAVTEARPATDFVDFEILTHSRRLTSLGWTNDFYFYSGISMNCLGKLLDHIIAKSCVGGSPWRS